MPALLISVGGSPEPVVFTLTTLRPTHVAYVCSAGSRASAASLQAQLDFAPTPDYLELTACEELGPCYAALRRELPAWLLRHGLAAADVTVDYTGGTKTMSAALVLAATELFSNFCYVGGTRRDKAGVGTVISGSERVFSQANPWRELAIREFDRAAILWAAHQYAAARDLLRTTKNQLPLERRPACERIVLLADALTDRLALSLHAAAAKCHDLAGKLRKNGTPPDIPGASAAHATLLLFADRAATRLSAAHAASGPASDPHAQLRELLDNALLTARLGRYDDAAARLYRALELFGQNELARLTGGAFHLGRLKADTLPPALAAFPLFANTDGLAIARRGIALEHVYRALAHLGHPAGQRAVADFDSPASLHTPWRQATQRRNQSILAHGVQPVSAEGFSALATLVADYTGEDLSAPELDAPAWDADWLG